MIVIAILYWPQSDWMKAYFLLIIGIFYIYIYKLQNNINFLQLSLPTTVADCKSYENTKPCMSMTKVNLGEFGAEQRPTRMQPNSTFSISTEYVSIQCSCYFAKWCKEVKSLINFNFICRLNNIFIHHSKLLKPVATIIKVSRAIYKDNPQLYMNKIKSLDLNHFLKL